MRVSQCGDVVATWILLGLEFALAADILRTAVAPTWDDISKLAVIATTHHVNYFLAKDPGRRGGRNLAKIGRIRK